MKIGLISDSHGYMKSDVLDYLIDCQEIWHAGDIGDLSVINKLSELKKTMRVVFGNIDTKAAKMEFEEDLLFELEGLKIFITHIGGYPPRYVRRIRDILEKEKPNLYVCGHSHILKIMPDRQLDLLHMNPGAIGYHGIHQIRTMITFHILDEKIKDVRVIELGRRGHK